MSISKKAQCKPSDAYIYTASTYLLFLVTSAQNCKKNVYFWEFKEHNAASNMEIWHMTLLFYPLFEL